MDFLKKIYNYWLKLDDKIRFIFIGGVNAAISFVIFAILVLCLGEKHHVLCITGQWVISSIPSYLNQKFFVFNTKGNYIKEYFKCCSTWVVSYILNVIFSKFIIIHIIKNVYINQILSIFVVSVATYILFKYFAFKPKKT